MVVPSISPHTLPCLWTSAAYWHVCAGKAKLLPSGFLFKKNAFIYLAEPSLSCGMWDLLLDQGFNLGALHCVCGVLAPGPPGMSPVSFSPWDATWPSCCCFHQLFPSSQHFPMAGAFCLAGLLPCWTGSDGIVLLPPGWAKSYSYFQLKVERHFCVLDLSTN